MQRILDRSAPGHGASRSPIGRLRDYAVPAVWVVLAPASVYAPKMTVVLLCALLLGFRDFSSTARVAKRLLATPAGLSLAALVLWCVISTTWAPGGVEAALTAARMVAIMVVGLLAIATVQQLDDKAARLSERCIYVYGLAALSLLLMELVRASFLDGVPKGELSTYLHFNNRASAILAVLAFPVAVALGRRSHGLILALGFATVSGAVLLLLPMQASFVAFVVGLPAFLLGYAFGKRGFHAVVVVASVAMLTAPWIAMEARDLEASSDRIGALPDSWQHRLYIWEFASTKAMQRPVLGHGFDASRVFGRESGLVRVGADHEPGGQLLVEKLPLHPHNLAVQIWLELGLVGIATCIGIFLGLARLPAALDDHRMATAMMSGCFTVFVCVGFLSFGAWQGWWLATGWFGATACVVVARGLRVTTEVDDGASRRTYRAQA